MIGVRPRLRMTFFKNHALHEIPLSKSYPTDWQINICRVRAQEKHYVSVHIKIDAIAFKNKFCKISKNIKTFVGGRFEMVFKIRIKDSKNEIKAIFRHK